MTGAIDEPLAAMLTVRAICAAMAAVLLMRLIATVAGVLA